MTSNAALVSGVSPGTVAVSVYPVPGWLTRRSENVATPFAARAWAVPVSVALPGLAPSATVIRLSAPATGVPLESTTATRTGLSCCPARALPGLLAKARPAGGSWDNWVPPPPVNSLSKWQLAMTAARASTKRVFIAADGRCKARTGSTSGNGRVWRGGRLNRHDTPAESEQQVWARHGRMVRRSAGAGSRERYLPVRGGYRSPLPAPLLQQASIHVRGLLCGSLPSERPSPRPAVLDQLFPAQRVV